MIDTVKLLIPLPSYDFLEKLKEVLTRTRRETKITKTLHFEYFTGEFQIGSYERTVNIYMSEKDPIGLFVEFSLPKQKYNNNVEMIHASEVPEILENFRNELCEHLKAELPPLSLWVVYRVDVCYNWTFETIEKCQSLMNFIQRIDFPRKKKYLYDTSVMYKGSVYTLKFYMKGPEFLKHDFKSLEKAGAMSRFELSEWANKVLRFEVEFKKGHLTSLFHVEKVRVHHIADDFEIEIILQKYLALVFRYINKENMKHENVRQVIESNFTPAKALRLYQFYKGYYYEPDEKFHIMKGLDRSTIYRYKKDLKSVGVKFTENMGDSEPVPIGELVIPSERAQFTLLDYQSNKTYITLTI